MEAAAYRRGVLAALCLFLALALAPAGCGGGTVRVKELAERQRTAPGKVKVGDIEVAYREFGRGEPLVMITGLSGTQDAWDPVFIDTLARERTVITFDNRGSGATTRGTKEYTVEQMAEDTAGFMEALDIGRAGVLGWSMGGFVAQELALQHPEMVERLVLHATGTGGREQTYPDISVLMVISDTSGTAAQRRDRVFALLVPQVWAAERENGRYMREAMAGASEETPAAIVEEQVKAYGGWRGSYVRLPMVRCPTLAVTGTLDRMTPPENSLKIAERVSGAWLAQFPGGGHGVQYQYPGQLADTVLNFLDAP